MTMASVLVIHGGDAEARRVFRGDGRGYWSAAIATVLEKHGYLDAEVTGPERLRDPATWAEPRVVLVTRLALGSWTEEIADAARTGQAQVLVEGPLEAPVHRALVVRALGPLGHECVVSVRDPALRAGVQARGVTPGCALAEARTEEVEIDEAMRWPRTSAPLTDAQARAWRAPGWDAERWELGGQPEDDREVLGEVAPTDDRRARTPGIVRHGSLTGASFSLFGYLAQAHTSEPVDGAEARSNARTLPLELMLLELLDEMHARAGLDRLRVLPWPQHAAWVLSIRHDVDRPPVVAELDRVLRRHRAAGTRATWYWRARHLRGDEEGRRAVARVAAAQGHEVALHTEQLWTPGATDALRTVERSARGRVRGSCAHGDRDAFRFQGAPNALWAYDAGLAYTELIQHAHVHPHRFVTLERDGVVRPLDLICLPHHESLDAGTRDGEHRADLIVERTELYRRTGGLMQVLNHPDIHLEALFAALDAAPQEGRLDWTAGEAADWWRRTHVAGTIGLAREGPRSRLWAREPVSGLVVERRTPRGVVSRHAVNLPAGGSVLL
jgi:hypothetical protein